MANHFQLLRSFPPSHLFDFPPTNVPDAIPPLHVEPSILRPFNIPDNLFTAALDAKVPLTIAITYAVTIKSLNIYNTSRSKKPWAISKTRPFRAFVILHNIFLAVYSAWTFYGMVIGMHHTVASPFGPEGISGTADSFCRIHGRPGLGNSVYYNETTSSFYSTVEDAAIVNGIPNKAEPGRMWNEGLAFYGWLFYISKFYEVLDTFIILAKGKLSSTLQTYHHAGAMLCMWAGMRYMSAPVWCFVVFNSLIHSLMYFYYTLTAFNIRVPGLLKRSLTSMQITQFVVGASSAMIHSFLYYTVPVTTSHPASSNQLLPKTESLPKATINALESIKRFVIDGSSAPIADAASASSPETTYVTQPCIVTTGETFAIWLNVLYLAPLTYLFVSFFIASYVKRSNAATKMSGKAGHAHADFALAEKAGWDAAKGIEKEVYGGEAMLSNGEESPVKDSTRKTRRV